MKSIILSIPYFIYLTSSKKSALVLSFNSHSDPFFLSRKLFGLPFPTKTDSIFILSRMYHHHHRSKGSWKRKFTCMFFFLLISPPGHKGHQDFFYSFLQKLDLQKLILHKLFLFFANVNDASNIFDEEAESILRLHSSQKLSLSTHLCGQKIWALCYHIINFRIQSILNDIFNFPKHIIFSKVKNQLTFFFHLHFYENPFLWHMEVWVWVHMNISKRKI